MGWSNDTADPITNLVTNFVAIAESARLRTNALAVFFPSLRDGSVALGIPAWNNEFHTLVDILPRPVCDYETIPVSPAHVGDGTTRLWNYCTTDDPTQQIRGSANAPRPDVPNNGATIPPGVDPNQRSTPLPPAREWLWSPHTPQPLTTPLDIAPPGRGRTPSDAPRALQRTRRAHNAREVSAPLRAGTANHHHHNVIVPMRTTAAPRWPSRSAVRCRRPDCALTRAFPLT